MDRAGAEVMNGGAQSGELSIFAYGSLMWRPGFPHIEAMHARLAGFRRSFCIYSVHHRGSCARPGLVLGLDRGGSCDGILYRVAQRDAKQTLDYLWRREQVTAVYREAIVPITLAGEAQPSVRAMAYIVERAHPTYAGHLPLATQARLISGAQGLSGTNVDYLVSTLNHLRALDIRDRTLERVLTLVGGLARDGRGCSRRRTLVPASRAAQRGPRFARSDLSRFAHRAAFSQHARLI